MRFTLIVAASQDTAGQAFGFINVPHGFVSDPGFQRIKRKPSEAVMPCRFTVDIIRNIQAPSSASLAGFLFFDNGEHESIRCERTASDWGKLWARSKHPHRPARLHPHPSRNQEENRHAVYIHQPWTGRKCAEQS